MTEARTPCSVPFCAKSLKGQWSWWLCKDHNRMVPMWVKARHRRLKARLRRMNLIGSDKRSWWCLDDRSRRIMDAAGREVIRAASNRAMGL